MPDALQDRFLRTVPALFFALALVAVPAAAQKNSSVNENDNKIKQWNTFVDDLLLVHRKRLETGNIKKTKRLSGYSRQPDYFREIEYRDAANGHLLSRIRWERENPDTAQMIEIFFYDRQGRVSVDYLAAYLPGYRNAPYQTLINIHRHDSELSAFRQFDASGELLFQKCQGDYFNRKVAIFLDDVDIPPDPSQVSEDLYTACFGLLPVSAGRYLKPTALIPGLQRKTQMKDDGDGELTVEILEQRISGLDRRIKTSPDQGDLYVKRGKNYFWLRQFDFAIADFTKAISLNDNLDAAYFGRGMAYGRNRELERGIEDLSVYIRRNPESSLAYTKRGVRYIWMKDFERARDDLKMAVSLDDDNAEAHDDLGVVMAQLGNPEEAIGHFQKSRTLDPGYQKAHHNLALVLYMVGELERALPAVNEAIRLQPDNRGSLLIKSNILDGLGRKQEAAALKERAGFLTEGNWSERSAIR
ncbi:MAG: tetratricopeptide repeat protein [Rhodospirillales bacterium]|nr:tetratricopeptide repeat protein [Rhodospirillales bacterium]